jgi:putative transposase
VAIRRRFCRNFSSDFLLTEKRDQEAALRLLKQAIRRHGLPETITIDGSEAHAAAIEE